MTEKGNRRICLNIPSAEKKLTYLIFVMPFLFGVLQEFLGLPGAVKYAVDAAWVLLALEPVLIGKVSVRQGLLPFLIPVGLFVLYTFTVYLFRFQSVAYYLWGIRNYLRFYVAFFAFTAHFTQNDGRKCLTFLDRIFWLNFAVCLYQYLSGYGQDYIGGIFGTTKGCNGYLVIYLCAVACKCVPEYMNGSASIWNCVSKCAGSLFLAAIGELKFFYVAFLVIVFAASFVTSFSLKKLLFLLFATVLISGAAVMLGALYRYFDGFLILDSLWRMLELENYGSGTDIGRFNAISFISNHFLPTLPDRIFGLGLGNCDTGALPLVQTDFHAQYVDLHYSIFSHAFLFLETGFVGVGLYTSFFLVSFLSAGKRLREGTGNRLFCQMALIGSLICPMLMIYNSSLRTEAGYLVYFVLALPFLREQDRIPPEIPAVSGGIRRNRKPMQTVIMLLFLAVFAGVLGISSVLDSRDAVAVSSDEEPAVCSIELTQPGEAVYLVNDGIVEWMKGEYSAEVLYNALREDGRLDTPLPVVLHYSIKNIPAKLSVASQQVVVSQYEDFRNAQIHPVAPQARRALIYNLNTNTTYYCRVTVTLSDGSEISADGTFTTAASPRFVLIDGIRNCRDIGGYQTIDGQTIRQGMIYRGTELDGAVSDKYVLTQTGMGTMLRELGIRTEIDLRAHDTPGVRDMLGSAAVHNHYGVLSYSESFTDQGKEAIRILFADLADPAAYPVYLHCTYGADRTGTVCYLIEALLGLSEDDLYREWELSAFLVGGAFQEEMAEFIESLQEFEGDTMQAKAENFLLSAGVTAEEIESIRRIMLYPG